MRRSAFAMIMMVASLAPATTEAQRQQAKTLAIIHGTVVDVETGALLKDAASAGSRVNTS